VTAQLWEGTVPRGCISQSDGNALFTISQKP